MLPADAGMSHPSARQLSRRSVAPADLDAYLDRLLESPAPRQELRRQGRDLERIALAVGASVGHLAEPPTAPVHPALHLAQPSFPPLSQHPPVSFSSWSPLPAQHSTNTMVPASPMQPLSVPLRLYPITSPQPQPQPQPQSSSSSSSSSASVFMTPSATHTRIIHPSEADTVPSKQHHQQQGTFSSFASPSRDVASYPPSFSPGPAEQARGPPVNVASPPTCRLSGAYDTLVANLANPAVRFISVECYDIDVQS